MEFKEIRIRFFSSVFLLLVGTILHSQCGAPSGAEPDRKFFAGGKSDISSSDANRAAKAIEKWSRPNGSQDDRPLAAAPFFWDYKKAGKPVFIRIIKNDNRKGLLEMWIEPSPGAQFELYKTYRIFQFSGQIGPKTAEGDFQAPEGFYYISRRRLNPASNYHLSMDLGFPNVYDRSKGYTGSDLMIHGSTPSAGCFAMTDCSIEQIYTLVAKALGRGQKFVRVHCFPFALTKENLALHRDSEHYEFWMNLKEGWDWFEEKKRPPNVEVRDGRYRFSDS